MEHPTEDTFELKMNRLERFLVVNAVNGLPTKSVQEARKYHHLLDVLSPIGSEWDQNSEHAVGAVAKEDATKDATLWIPKSLRQPFMDAIEAALEKGVPAQAARYLFAVYARLE